MPRARQPDYAARPVKDQPVTQARAGAPLAVVHWSYPDGSTVTSGPLQIQAAEAVARAYVERYPDRTSWLSVPSALARTR